MNKYSKRRLTTCIISRRPISSGIEDENNSTPQEIITIKHVLKMYT
jgi:hypothetical protein